jgi:hypothetical protein
LHATETGPATDAAPARVLKPESPLAVRLGRATQFRLTESGIRRSYAMAGVMDHLRYAMMVGFAAFTATDVTAETVAAEPQHREASG